MFLKKSFYKDFIYNKESLTLLGTYVAAFGFLILREFHIKKKELIGQKLILIFQSIILLFSKDSSTIIYLVYFSLSYAKKGEK